MIKQLTLISRTLLVHAQGLWPKYITTMLWPYALKAAQDRMNQLNVNLDGQTPDMKFSGVASKHLRMRDFHTQRCPCYIHNSRLIPEDNDPVTSIELREEMFHMGETLLYSNAGHTTYVRVKKIYLNNDATLRIHV